LSETIPGSFQGRFRVTCLVVVGPEAAMGLVPTDAASNDGENEVVFTVLDSGLGGGAGDMFGFLLDTPADSCAAGIGEAVVPIEHGNILVHDALP
jgi:hypothetical protein